MKTSSITFFFLLFISMGYAQMEVSGMDNILLKLQIKNDIEGAVDNSYTNIEGNPFMYENFSPGEIKIKNDGIHKGLLRFDKYAGEIHFKKLDNVFAIAFPEKIEYIDIDGVRFIYSDYILPNSKVKKNASTYFVQVVDGWCKLLIKKNTVLKESKPSVGIVEAKPAKFIDNKDSFFIKIGDDPAELIQNNKTLLLALADKETQIATFIKKEKLSYKKIEDLKKIINYYNLLKSAK